MPRPKQARLATAYDIGRSGEPSERYGFNADELAAYDQGLSEFDDAEDARARKSAEKGAGAPPKPATKPGPAAPSPAAGPAPAKTAPTSPPSTRPPASSPSSGGGLFSGRGGGGWSSHDGGGLVLGVIAWFLGLAYLRGGTAGVKQLLEAKLVNKTSKAVTNTSQTPSAPPSSSSDSSSPYGSFPAPTFLAPSVPLPEVAPAPAPTRATPAQLAST